MYFFERIDTEKHVEFKPKYVRFWTMELIALAGVLWSIQGSELVFFFSLGLFLCLSWIAEVIDGVDLSYWGRTGRFPINPAFFGMRKLLISKTDLEARKRHADHNVLYWYVAVTVAILISLIYVYWR